MDHRLNPFLEKMFSLRGEVGFPLLLFGGVIRGAASAVELRQGCRQALENRWKRPIRQQEGENKC